MAEGLADSASPRYALAAAFAAARRVITTMHTEAIFALKSESATLAFQVRNRALLPCGAEAHAL